MPMIRPRLRNSILACAAALAFMACSRTPKEVIKPGRMAELLADVHTAEAVTDNNYQMFGTDSAKRALKQAVFDAHHVTQEQFDTSLVWYAHNIGMYIEVYDKTIEILEKRSSKAGALAAREAMSMAGDSVDVWTGSPYLFLTSRLPSKYVSFDIAQDENFQNGDIYTMRAKVLDAQDMQTAWTFVANYDDGYVDYLQGNSAVGKNEWVEMTFVSDSTRALQRLRGGFEPFAGDRDLWIDSIMLVRKRIDPRTYSSRYRIRQYPSF